MHILERRFVHTIPPSSPARLLLTSYHFNPYYSISFIPYGTFLVICSLYGICHCLVSNMRANIIKQNQRQFKKKAPMKRSLIPLNVIIIHILLSYLTMYSTLFIAMCASAISMYHFRVGHDVSQQ